MYHIGAVILNYQNYKMTEKCIDKILRLKAHVYLVIVDNASSNESFEYLKNKYETVETVSVIRNDINGGYSVGNNTGIRYLFDKYPNVNYACIMNPDVEIMYPEIFTNLSNKLDSDNKLAVITGLMVTNKVLKFRSCTWNIPKRGEIAWGHCLLWKNKICNTPVGDNGIAMVQVVPGSFFMIKRKVYEMIGGLDENVFLYNEENLLGCKLRELGLKEALSINDFYFHNHVKGPRKSLKQKIISRKYGNQSRRYLCKKYYNKLDLLLLDIVILLNYFIISLLHFVGNICILMKIKR